jgi:prolyl-tRNA editing enzyme YbaK/EbsC (Cys-tRNA(Pro) deacylase)
VTAPGITTLPIYIDSRVMQQTEVVMGGGNRSSKLLLNPQELLKLPNTRVVENLVKLSG